MYQIRIHGRGGQGAVTAAYLLAMAAFEEGKWSQAFPMFGVERRGAPVQSFLRIDDKPIRIRSHVYKPDYVLVLDPTLVESVDVASGAKKMVIINSAKDPKEFKIKGVDVRTVDVSKFAIEILGKNITNTGILCAFSAITGLIKVESIYSAMKKRFRADIAKKNIQLCKGVCGKVCKGVCKSAK